MNDTPITHAEPRAVPGKRHGLTVQRPFLERTAPVRADRRDGVDVSAAAHEQARVTVPFDAAHSAVASRMAPRRRPRFRQLFRDRHGRRTVHGTALMSIAAAGQLMMTCALVADSDVRLVELVINGPLRTRGSNRRVARLAHRRRWNGGGGACARVKRSRGCYASRRTAPGDERAHVARALRLGGTTFIRKSSKGWSNNADCGGERWRQRSAAS